MVRFLSNRAGKDHRVYSPRLILVAYAVEPGPGGPEAHVNSTLVKALVEYWPADITVISGGTVPDLPKEAQSRCRFIGLGDPGVFAVTAGPTARLLAGCARELNARGLRTVGSKVVNRGIHSVYGSGVKMLAWEIAAARALDLELGSFPEAVVYSRALPFESISAVGRVRRARQFPWIVNINDPMPPNLWPGMYQSSIRRNRTMHRGLEKLLPRVDAVTFPSANLRDLEAKVFESLRAKPTAILPHITMSVSARAAPIRDHSHMLRISFAGTLRSNRVRPEFTEALVRFTSEFPEKAKDLLVVFHLARETTQASAFIKSLPVATETRLGEFDDVLATELLKADVLLDLESEPDEILLLTKLANSIGLRKPIWSIAVPGGTAWNLITANQCGYVSALGNSGDTYASLVNIHDDWKSHTLDSKKPSDVMVAQFGGAHIVDDLYQLVVQVSERSHFDMLDK